MLPRTPEAQIRPIRLGGTERPPRHLCAVRESTIATRTPESESTDKEGNFLLESYAAAIHFWDRRRNDLDTHGAEIASMPYFHVSKVSNDQPPTAQDAPRSISLSGPSYVRENKARPDGVIDSDQERIDREESSHTPGRSRIESSEQKKSNIVDQHNYAADAMECLQRDL